MGQCAPQLCCLLLKLFDDCIDCLVSLQNLVLRCDQWNKIMVVERLLRREHGIIKVEFSIHVIRRVMIIKHGSHSIPWLYIEEKCRNSVLVKVADEEEFMLTSRRVVA